VPNPQQMKSLPTLLPSLPQKQDSVLIQYSALWLTIHDARNQCHLQERTVQPEAMSVPPPPPPPPPPQSEASATAYQTPTQTNVISKSERCSVRQLGANEIVTPRWCRSRGTEHPHDRRLRCDGEISTPLWVKRASAAQQWAERNDTNEG
jgi:hypothetical protein